MTSEPSRSTLAARPAPEVPLTATTVTAGSTRSSASAGHSASSAAVGIAAGHGDPGGAAQPVAAAGQFGQPVGPAAGVLGSVEPLPRGGVGEPEVGAAVDDQRVGAELIGQRRGMAVRQREEHDVVAGEDVDFGGLEHPGRQRQQMRMVLGRASCRRSRPRSAPPMVSRPSA